MVDIDLKDPADEKKKGKPLLERTLNKTLQKIKESIGGNPTVPWTGNGYHVYQPVSGFILEEYETFYKFTKYLDKDLTSMFIQFAEEYFTDYAADRLHNPTVKSCLTRIPRSLNSKCIAKGVDAEVKII
ncbi:MAG: hypothetical protein ACJ72C_08930, partial [Nitrososphaeraceae archaeon]